MVFFKIRNHDRCRTGRDGTGRGRRRGRTRVVVRDGEVHAGLRLRRYGGVRHGGSRGGHHVAVARRGRRTSTDVTDEIGKAGTLPRRPPERAPHPSPSRVKTKRAARRGEHPGRLTADDRLARASSCGASRRRLPESARKLDIPRRNLGALRAAKNFLKRLALDCSCALQAGEIIHRLKR